ncbi:MAG: hypothetical protein KDD00_13390 [Ignavibacteriae bacterium]|nr:hypothetical protein [Ignavibacteriota bacterium]
MKNKTFISFLINILIGILFSFPVFSAQGSIENYINSNEEYYVTVNQSESFSVSESTFLPSRQFNFYHLSDSHSSKYLKTNLTAGNKDNHLSDFSLQLYKDLNRKYFLSDFILKNPCYVNLSYLKDLKTTKMLC